MAEISVIAELEALGERFIPAGPEEIKVLCPFHEDKDPSCCLNTEKLVFNCKTCQTKGDFVTWMAKRLNVSRNAVLADLGKRYQLDSVKAVDPSVIERAHAKIWSSGPLIQALYDRGVTDAMIRKHRLGVLDEGRISIPIKVASGVFVNIRRYLPGAPGPQKMKNMHGRGQMRLFPVEQLEFPDIAICGGEIKAVVALEQLNQHNVGALTACGGEGNWSHTLSPSFNGKGVYVIMDVDDAGIHAASKIAAQLKGVAKWIKIVTLPLDRDKHPKGDINDFVAKENGNLWDVLSNPEYVKDWHIPDAVVDENEEPTPVSFSETLAAHNVGKRMEFEAVITAAAARPFVIPKQLQVNCGKSQDCCPLCTVFPKTDTNFSVPAESPAVLKMVGVEESQMDIAIRNALGIPRKCNDVLFEIKEHWHAEDVRINPSLEITNQDTERTLQQAICISCDASLNNTYKMIGRLYPHPKTQMATLVVSKATTTNDALTKYVPQRLDELVIFQPKEWSLAALEEKLTEIYDDLAANVTRVFLRQDNHLFTDLSYHSPLLISIDGKETRGWTDILIMGDSSCGKTEAAFSLQRHYGLGAKAECKNASIPGLLGGLRTMGTEWFVSWGVIPTNDRRQVILEEAKGISHQDISRLTDMRSSGVAEIPKIEKRRTLSRTRLLWLSNPRGGSGRTMATFAYGIEAIRDLIGAPEDIRRFDAALIVSNTEVTAEQHGNCSARIPKGEPKYTSELCRELILWSWTRKREQVVFAPDAIDLIRETAGAMCKTYSEDIPLVDGGSMRAKIARLSAAIAVRTFSCSESGQEILVRRCHVEFIYNTLNRVYSSRIFGYKYFSDASKATATMTDTGEIKLVMEALKEPEDVRERFLHTDLIDIIDLQDWCGYDRYEAQQLISLLVRKRALHREGRSKYRKSPEFIDWLRAVELTPAPAHLRKDSKF